MRELRWLAVAAGVALLQGCSATPVMSQARNIEIVSDPPDKTRCAYLGEVAGSQGNWITGDFTTNKNLVIGARNDLRNETYRMGGNLVYLQETVNTNSHDALGTTNTTVVGKAYKCLDR